MKVRIFDTDVPEEFLVQLLSLVEDGKMTKQLALEWCDVQIKSGNDEWRKRVEEVRTLLAR